MDHEQLRVVARGLDATSIELSLAARRLAADLASLTWSSRAGDRWRSAVDGLIGRALRACGSLDEIAAQLRI